MSLTSVDDMDSTSVEQIKLVCVRYCSLMERVEIKRWDQQADTALLNEADAAEREVRILALKSIARVSEILGQKWNQGVEQRQISEHSGVLGTPYLIVNEIRK